MISDCKIEIKAFHEYFYGSKNDLIYFLASSTKENKLYNILVFYYENSTYLNNNYFFIIHYVIIIKDDTFLTKFSPLTHYNIILHLLYSY